VEFDEITTLIHPDDRSRIVTAEESDSREGDRIEQEYRVIHPDTGEIRYIHGIREIVRDEHGRMIGRFGTVMDVTERRKAEEHVRLSRERLRNLATRLQEIREEEHTLIAREIHDELGQALTGLRLDLSWLKNRLPKNWKVLPERIGGMIKEVDNQIDYVRNLSSSIRPAMLDDLGLGAAIEWQVQGFSTRTGCRYTLDISQLNFSNNYELETAVFRIFQEALNNIARHADADHIRVSLPKPDKNLVLTIRDNGVGITQDQLSNPHSIGIIGMHERAGAFGGKVSVQKLDVGGTQVTVTIPYNDGE
jgi:two-component system, NarL family, sensor histidine kinase UhpB